jgi:hypothetical protein
MNAVGYHHCACPDCFELYVGEPGELCLDCEDCCDGESECQAEGAYDLGDCDGAS